MEAIAPGTSVRGGYCTGESKSEQMRTVLCPRVQRARASPSGRGALRRIGLRQAPWMVAKLSERHTARVNLGAARSLMFLEPKRNFVRNSKVLFDFLRPARGTVEPAEWGITRAHSPVR